MVKTAVIGIVLIPVGPAFRKLFEKLPVPLDQYTEIPYISIMEIVFIETPFFIKKFDRVASMEDFERLQADLLQNPYRGDIIKGTGGARKIRMRLGHGGKSGGARIVYYFVDLRGEIWLLDIYVKNEKGNLSESEKNNLFSFIKESIK